MKFAAIADWADSDGFPVEFMCRELGVSRSGCYAWRSRAPSARDEADAGLLAVIKAVYERLRGNPGVRRVHAELAGRHIRVAALHVGYMDTDMVRDVTSENPTPPTSPASPSTASPPAPTRSSRTTPHARHRPRWPEASRRSTRTCPEHPAPSILCMSTSELGRRPHRVRLPGLDDLSGIIEP